ncbi:MAG: DUF3090 family protein [Ilumatobacteraceae bacterium]|nr:DUF3090 family protein [Ilumatobacteraceae bacterium]
MSAFYEFEEVDAFTTGAIGRPGERVFYLQARAGRQRLTVKCEKQQVGAIVQYLRRVLSDLPPADERPMASNLELTDPSESLFVLGPIGLGYDRSSDRLVVQLEEMVPADLADDESDDDTDVDDDEPTRGHIRLYVSRSQAVAFCDHAERVIAAGRPDCQWCGLPIDPDGHACPRMN